MAIEEAKLGEIAYHAYCEATDFRSLLTGDPLPEWDSLNPDIRGAWIASACKVDQAVRREMAGYSEPDTWE